jgi:SAM-dependent methyltransferase
VDPFDELAERYDAWFAGEEGKLIFQIELAALRSTLKGLPWPWLEVGVGSGRFAQALGINLGINPSGKLLEMARQRSVSAIRGRGERLPSANGSFGTIFLIVTICFVEAPEPVLRECHRVLRRDGRLVIGLVPRESPWGKLYIEESQHGHPFYSQAEFYTTKEVEGLWEGVGFQLERCSSTLFQPPGRGKGLEEPWAGCDPHTGFVALLARR